MAIKMNLPGSNIDSNDNNINNESKDIDNIKQAIKEGLLDTKNRSELIDSLLDNIEIYGVAGINDKTILLLQNMNFVFKNTIPAILKGDYESLIKNNNDNTISDESIVSIYKDIRKQLVSNLINKK